MDALPANIAAAGHEWDVYDVCKMNIHGCLACEYCHTKGNGQCVQKDDMQNIYQQLQEAEMLVIASPIYYHGLSGQLKCTIDRFYAAAYPMTVPCFLIGATFWIICSWKVWESLPRMVMIRVCLKRSWKN